MLELLTSLYPEVKALRAMGTVTARDYERTFAPTVQQARRTGSRMRLLYQFGPEFRRLTPGALWADTRLGFTYLRLLDGCAVVSDIDWIREPTRRIGARMPCPVRVFGNDEHDEAVTWLHSLPKRTGASGRDLAVAYFGGVGAGLGGVAGVLASKLVGQSAR